MARFLDSATLATLVATLLLFAASLLTQGLTHDLFLEGAVFLVSVKLVISSYKSKAASDSIQEKLDAIRAELRSLKPASREGA